MRSPTEIAFALKSIMEKGALVTAYFRGGTEFALTSIVAVLPDKRQILVDPGPTESVNSKWLQADDMLFITAQGQIKIKFTASRVEETQMHGRRAFRVPMPEFLVRLQRREYFRITTSLLRPIVCTVPVTGITRDAEAVVADLSCGGAALIDNHHALDFEIGNVYSGCRLVLTPEEKLNLTIEVRNLSEMTLRNGLSCWRAGCRFVDLSPAAQGLLQRFIMNAELAAKSGPRDQ